MKTALSKKLTLLFLVVALSVSFIPQSFAAPTLTEIEKQQLINLGYPSAYKSYMQTWYNEFCSEVPPEKAGAYEPFSAFCNFVYNLRYASSPSSLHEFAVVARAVFDEVANESGQRVESMYGVWDCLTNRVANYNSTWSSYYEAASLYGLNSLNVNMPSTYWKSMNVTRPIESASFSKEARLALIKCWAISHDKHSLGAYCSPDPHYKFTSLPWNYKYFNKTSGANRILIGVFYHRIDF
ncbi:MAG: hypothetical protein ACOYIG_10260 [Acetivibrionales bacterium]|jgi:hypothetical protein|nr:hypothetical protein [Clostridiaceae bacterium]